MEIQGFNVEKGRWYVIMECREDYSAQKVTMISKDHIELQSSAGRRCVREIRDFMPVERGDKQPMIAIKEDVTDFM